MKVGYVESYLAGQDPRAQSGFRGNEERWERLRRPIMDAVQKNGTFLDVGCANGYLMESVYAWGKATGYHVEPYGVDIAYPLVTLARARLPGWANRIWHANINHWRPPLQFTYVRTELVYTPRDRRPLILARLLDEAVERRGRLIVCSYGSRRQSLPTEDVAALLASWGFSIAGESAGTEEDGTRMTSVAWLERE